MSDQAVTFSIRRLRPDDAAAFQALRLRGLLECPTAFASSYAEEAGEAVSAVAERLAADVAAPGASGVYGAWQGEALVAVAGLARERMAKLSHKAMLWGMYVAPEARRYGIAQALLQHVLAQAAAEPGLTQVMLGVHAGNAAAIALYRSVGFVGWGTEPAAACVDGVPHDETWMVCMLGARPPKPSVRPAWAVLVHSPDPDAARAWYQRLWPEARQVHLDDPAPFDLLVVDGVRLEFVRADAKVASGRAGTVVYWPVDDFDQVRARAEALGATLYRGPMAIEEGWRMAQFVDPFGNLFGLRGG
ncbi:GNAT family N-acetyltransferase [Ideonella sp. DXS29W]|uniref:GNAT family N-acetyltransferase n=1 Tax=Ideonella lacteola TaxID=2984193 RepID=A0ABU9BQL3_9BURK